jgi:hypothetical protein
VGYPGSDNGGHGALCQLVILPALGCLRFDLHRASLFPESDAQPLNFNKRNTVTVDVGVQTHGVMVGINGHKTMHEDAGTDITEEEAVTSLPASALASVLKWSKDIAADIHLVSGMHINFLSFVTDFAN